MSFPIKLRRTLPAAFVLLMAAGMISPPVRANSWADSLRNQLFGNLYQKFVEFFPQIASGIGQWQSLLDGDPCQSAPILFAAPPEPGWCTGNTLVGTGGSISSLLKVSVGKMEVPDPAAARSDLRNNLNKAGETDNLLQSNPEAYAQELGNVSDRAATNINAQTVLSQAGQRQMQSEIEKSSEIVQSILDTSDEAQSLNATQDVVKALARIQAQHAIISNLGYVSSLRDRIDRQFTNLNLANISRALDVEVRNRQGQSAADSYLLVNLSAQSSLKTTRDR